MIGRLLCRIGIHSWSWREVAYPHEGAPVPLGVERIYECRRCRLAEREFVHARDIPDGDGGRGR